MSSKAFLFDLNGTIIDDMGFHTIAWHKILTEDLGANLTQDEVKLQMYGKNSELLERVFGAGHFSDEEMERYSFEKERRYQEAYRPYLKLIDGLDLFLEKAHLKNVKMAIGSAAIPFNIDFVLDNLKIRRYFPVVVSADDVVLSKPDPETFVKAADLLGINPLDCIVFEDNPKGVEAALRGGMKAVVITTMHEPWEFKHLPNILAFVDNYTDPFLDTLL
ncbi:HAD-IA family hydrolase [Pedobacter sp. HMF7647]|uniref:HAD-IA family hydrolase n=1 Tax=Hufsiella arboris TaxID=2695275 RepID=A0A7K1Y862_9SPHI|nr:HAD family phosphatase [Hufsiella arboris]MXV50783.1 HAD-IA family hydrolase [Hufsiella arboris]